MSELKPCPCCGGKAVITKGYTSTLDTWPQGTFHRVFCGACQLRQLFHASPEAAADAWNRRPQPEATKPAQADERCPIVHGGSVEVAHLIAIAKATGLFGMATITDIKNYSIALLNEFAVPPAQDLGAAILAMPCTVPEELLGHQAAVFGYKRGFNSAMSGASQLAIAFGTLASPADALVAGDREKLAEVREAVLKYFDDLSERRNGGVAQYHLINRIEEVLGMSWRSGVNHRAAIQAQKDGHG